MELEQQEEPKIEEADFIENDTDTPCQCCGNKLTNYSILICFDCLDVEASNFIDLISKLEKEDE